MTQVESDSPGAKAGLKVGDVITQLDGHEVSDASELQVEVGQKSPGTTAHLQVMRDGKSVAIPVTVEAMGNRDRSGKETADAEPGKPDDKEYGHKKKICHDKGPRQQTIEVSDNAVPAHLAHGDTLGECPKR